VCIMIIHFTCARPRPTVARREERLMSHGHQAPDLTASVARHGSLSVRPAVETDAAAISNIYNQGIEDRIATLETELRSPEERREWLRSRGPRHPVIVAEADETVTERSEPQARAGVSPGAPALAAGQTPTQRGARA